MEGDVFGVRIQPSVVQFFNTELRTKYEIPVSVKNISNTSKNIRFYGPKNELEMKEIDTCYPNFTLKVNNPSEAVAPGLSVNAVVFYFSGSGKPESDRLVVTVDGDVVEIPLHAYPSLPMIEIDSEANFGTIVSNSKVVAREILLHNKGSKAGNFQIRYTGTKPLTFIPATGSVPPNGQQILKVEIVAKNPGKFNEEAEIFLEDQGVSTLEVKGCIAERALELLSVTDENAKIQCIQFGNTYYGTDRTECAFLYNNGPEPINFVAVIDEDAIAQEFNVDLTKSTHGALAEEGEDKSRRGRMNDITSLVSTIPNQGILKPYQKTPVFFRFSPRWYGPKQGWKSLLQPPPRRDFAIFLRFQIIGSSSGFIRETESNVRKTRNEETYAEVALRATALPVLLTVLPSLKFDFGECPMNQHVDIMCTVKNESNVLAATFEFRRIAHFTAHPPNGKILAGQTQDVIFTFAPKQAGNFKVDQLIEVLGHLADPNNPMNMYSEIIFTLPISFTGKSNLSTIKPKAKFNPGITPQITNEIGRNTDTTFRELGKLNLKSTLLKSNKTKLHRIRTTRSADYTKDPSSKVAFPNDRPRSIRPFSRHEHYQTLFTRADRHNYIDPDYALTDSTTRMKKIHRSGYVKQLHKKRELRILKKQRIEFYKTNNDLDIGIKHGSGIRPHVLSQDEIVADPADPPDPNAEWKLLSTKQLAEAEKNSNANEATEGLNAVPTTLDEKRDCSKWLTPQQLHQIVVGPPIINLGKVCRRSVCQKSMNVINNLNQYIHIVSEIDCKELRQSSPLSQVVPPNSKAVIPIIFESNSQGRFQRSVTYTINGFYKHHVTVLADVVPVSLELSMERLILKPSPSMPSEAGFRNVITLRNVLNSPAEFTWSPDLGEKGTAFSIRPATGSVEPGSDLDCEVVWHPSYLAPEDGSFTLLVSGGDSQKLICHAELGVTNIAFMDQRISFGTVPINLTTVSTAILVNAGTNHGYFQVLDPNPISGLAVSPVHGVVPVGGCTEIRVALTPDMIMKFDTRVQISIKGGKTLELRIGGFVEPPNFNIDLQSFNFGGVHCGSSAVMPFRVTNQAITKCRLEVDLTRYKDFTLSFPGFQSQEDFNYQLFHKGTTTVTLEPEETIEGELVFSPTQIAAYDFKMPITANHISLRCPLKESYSKSHSGLRRNTSVMSDGYHMEIENSVKNIVGTALRQPLQLGTNRLEFVLPSTFHENVENITTGTTKALLLINDSGRKLSWGLDLNLTNDLLEKGIFRFVHEMGVPLMTGRTSAGVEGELEADATQTILISYVPPGPGRHHVVVPVFLYGNPKKPIQYLELFGEMKAPELRFSPESLVLPPLPLNIDYTHEFNVLAMNYDKKSKIIAVLPEIEIEEDVKISPLSVTFLQGNTVKAHKGPDIQTEPQVIPCKLTFNSKIPISFCRPVTFSDEFGKRFELMVTATADNCLLTCYPFLALHRGDHQIVCELGSTVKETKTPNKTLGEAVILPCKTPTNVNSRPSTSATSSNFQISTSSYETLSSQSDSDYSLSQNVRDGAHNRFTNESDLSGSKIKEQNSRSANSAIFPDEDTEEGLFHMEVLLSVQRWFSAQGWHGGPYPILIPETLRMAITKKPASDPNKSKKDKDSDKDSLTEKKPNGRLGLKLNTKTKTKSGYNKLSKTIYDMITYLSGRPIPGIPINNPLPADPIERVKQIHWQHCTLLTFIRCQGGCVASVHPEYLMGPADFVIWRQLQRSVKLELLQQGNLEEADKVKVDDDIEEEMFEAISKRMWTDVCLQIFKVLVLARITPKTLKALSIPERDVNMPLVNPEPLASNIYSVPERILLTWMNHYYKQARTEVWCDCVKGGIPPSRWIVNFDFDLMDGLVIGALLGAHMPSLIHSHLKDMYSRPKTAEECLHNALKVVTAMHYMGIEYDIQAIDITDPNPVTLLMLIVHLYQRLPQYLPKTSVEFIGCLHAAVTRQIKITNTSPKSLTYTALIAGKDARDFTIPKGNTITIPPKSTIPVHVEFRSRYLRSASAVLIFVARRQGPAMGNTLTFNLTTETDHIKPKAVVKVESPCYEMEKIMLQVTNPFPTSAEFKIVLVEINNQNQENAVDIHKTKAKSQHGTKPSRETLGPKKDGDHDGVSSGISTFLIQDTQECQAQKNSQVPTLQAFFTPKNFVQLGASENMEVEVDFLPFHVGDRQCSIIFVNENIGEFLYSIEAKGLEPLPSYLPYMPSTKSVRISSSAAEGSSKGMYGGNQNTIYWVAESGQFLKETLLIPVTNTVRERALMTAAHQQMSDIEIQRRQLTGTIMSCSVTSNAIKNLSNNPRAAATIAKSIGPVSDVYRVESDSEFFKVPSMIVMPSQQNDSQIIQSNFPKVSEMTKGVAELPVRFKTKDPGIFRANITLRAIDDIRVYRIECRVNPPGSNMKLSFHAPLHQFVTQEIPVYNPTAYDWTMLAKITGKGFSGPMNFTVKANTSENYPLVFTPEREVEVPGSLVLMNVDDKSEIYYTLTGRGDKPLALDHIKVICGAKASIIQRVKVPNVTKKKLTYKVETDLSFVTGQETVTVLPNQSGIYSFVVTPIKRGVYKGVLAFVAIDNTRAVDSDGEEEPEDESSRKYCGYRMWYSLEVEVKAPVPERSLTVTCACQKEAKLEILVRNPTPKDITLFATIRGSDLSGPMTISLPPGEKEMYTLTFSPCHVGKRKGSLIFYSDEIGEFWYDLVLIAEPPPPTTLPNMECELGNWTNQVITLTNPTKEALELTTVITNANNFMLEKDSDRIIHLQPEASVDIQLNFMPSYLGEADHVTKVIFKSQQLGEWLFLASGSGLLPRPQPAVSVFTACRTNSTIIIPFRNPTDIAVLANIYLTETEKRGESLKDAKVNTLSPFQLLLKHSQDLRVGPKSTLEIPINFAPQEMSNCKMYCTVVVRPEDGSVWKYTPKDTRGFKYSVTAQGLKDIRWLYPILGVPEYGSNTEMNVTPIESEVRQLTDLRLEAKMSGVAPASSENSSANIRAKTPLNKAPVIPSGVVVVNTMATAEEFSFELSYPNDDVKKVLENAVDLSIIRHYRDYKTGLVTIVFGIKYKPLSLHDYTVNLLVTAAAGGLWKFPLRFVAIDGPVDDTISIEASGLGKVSSVGFRLFSQQRDESEKFKAYFDNGSEPEFSISPEAGELLPRSTEGTLFVLSFQPKRYGKIYKAKLVVEVPDMLWTYEIKGIIPEYEPPRGISSQPMAGPHPPIKNQQKKNISYIRENIKLITTAVSSPIKGASLLRSSSNKLSAVSLLPVN